MVNYVKDLLPRLQNFNKSLDQTSVFIDKPWINLDPIGNQVQYIFQRSGKLLISKSGKAHLGTWEYIAASNSLLIDRGNDLILLNQVFVEDAVLFLKPDGTNDVPWILVNKHIIPDLNYERYLDGLIQTTTKLKRVRSGHNEYYYSDSSNRGTLTIGSEIFDSNQNLLVQPKQIELQGLILSMNNGKIRQFLFPHFYNTNLGEVTVNQSNRRGISIGDAIFQNQVPVSDGKLYLIENNSRKSLKVRKGKIQIISSRFDRIISISLLVILGLLGLFMISIPFML